MVILELARGGVLTTGTGRIADTVTRMGAPGIFLVRAYDRESGLLVRHVLSDASGAYVIDRIPKKSAGIFIVAYDAPNASNPVNAAIADFVTPEPMP